MLSGSCILTFLPYRPAPFRSYFVSLRLSATQLEAILWYAFYRHKRFVP
jgi:hypothetical protein